MGARPLCCDEVGVVTQDRDGGPMAAGMMVGLALLALLAVLQLV